MNSRLPDAHPASQRQLRAKNEILPADVEGAPKPKTVALREEIVTLKERGLTNRAIANKVGKDPSYVTKLLKG
jgi:hypothetical protein